MQRGPEPFSLPLAVLDPLPDASPHSPVLSLQELLPLLANSIGAEEMGESEGGRDAWKITKAAAPGSRLVALPALGSKASP